MYSFGAGKRTARGEGIDRGVPGRNFQDGNKFANKIANERTAASADQSAAEKVTDYGKIL